MKQWKKSAVWLLWITAVFLIGGCERQKGVEVYGLETAVQTETAVRMESTVEERIVVDVCGAVKLPGVYELLKGDRVYQAIEMAGGMLAEAEEKAVNQAALLTDGQQLYVPFEGEAEEIPVSSETDGKVDLNTADLSELMTLPGIGESRAQDIIAYREEHGEFSSIEEIKNVSGIKDAAFEKMKDKIIVR